MKTTTSKLLKDYRADPIGTRAEIERVARTARAELMHELAVSLIACIGRSFTGMRAWWVSLHARRPRPARPYAHS